MYEYVYFLCFQRRKVLNKENQLVEPYSSFKEMKKTCYRHRNYFQVLEKFVPSPTYFEPDFIIHVDASNKGYGAHLRIRNVEKVQWICEQWSEDFKSKYIYSSAKKNLKDSTFGEMYAFIAVCYTWKHLFINNRVLCYSDNASVVKILNMGMYASSEDPNQKYRKLCELFFAMIEKYNIDLLACHLDRDSNVEADLLANKEIEMFRKQIPEAYDRSKKSKKLYFCLPFY